MIFKSKKDDQPDSVRQWIENLEISVEIPAGWSISDNQFFALFIAAEPEDRYRANIGINAGTIDPATEETLEAIFQQAYEQQKNSYVNYKLLDSSKTKIDGCPALIRQIERHEPNSGLDMTQIQALVLGPQAAYNISATSLTKHADKYIPVLNDILRSIKFEDEE